MNNFDEVYTNLLNSIMTQGYIEQNQRTKTETRALSGALLEYTIENYLPIIGARKIFPYVAAAELAWTLLGTQDTTFIKKYSKMWDKFEDEPGMVNAAYGYRYRKHFGRDQLIDAINSIKVDRSNRQIWVTTWDPGTDGLLNIGKNKNTPCILGFMLNTVGGKLNMVLILRSSDTIVGLPYDCMMYSLLLAALSNSVKIPTGKISVLLGNAHIYEKHYNLANRMINSYNDYKKNGITVENEFVPQSISLAEISNYSIEDIANKPDEYVNTIKAAYKGYINNLIIKPKMEYPEVIQ